MESSEGAAQLSFLFVLLQIEFGLCGKTERDRGVRRGGGWERKKRMSQHVFKICVSSVVH